MLSHDRIWAAIDALAERHRLSASGLARKSGLDPTAFNKSKRRTADGRNRWPSTESLAKVLEATGASLEEFMELVRGPAGLAEPHLPIAGSADDGFGPLNGAHGHDGLPQGNFPPQQGSIPLLGFAQAGAGGFFDDGGFPVGQGWDVVDFPAAPNEHGSVYALEVQGDSMLPLYRDGDVLIVEPGAQVRRGDRVVVKTREGEVMAKVLFRQSSKSIELVSLNPEHPNRSLDVGEVEWVARIVWASQ